MKSLQRAGIVLLIALLAIVPAIADKAKSLYDKGRGAEAKQQYEEAYDLYKQAYDIHPEDLRYRTSYERLKFLAAAAKVHRGQVLRDAGKLSEAMGEFQAAANIDPSNALAQQEIKRTAKMIQDAQNPQGPRSSGDQKTDSLASLAGPVQLAPISQTPLTLRMVEDSKVIYETIGKLAGINVLFDPDYTSRRIRIELNQVSLEQALQIVALQSRTFWRPVTPNTIYIAQDTTQKRNDIDQQVLRTFYLSNLSTTSELQDVTNVIRTVLRAERVQQIPTQNAIVMRGTPDQIALAELLINNLDKSRAEVVVDIAILQVNKDKLRNLGILPPFTSTNSPTISFQNPSTTTSSTTSSTSTTNTSTSGLTLNDLANLDARDFAVTIPSSSVSFLLNDSNTRTIQKPQIRSIDGQKATLKIGERVPVATGSFGSTIGNVGVGVSPLVQTQFNYTDVGVNIEVTPHIHGNGDVSLKTSVEVSAIDRTENIGGIDQPVIGQRKIDHEIRLRDGEVNMLGGIMEHSDVQNLSGLPWLSQIPVLKYLFGRDSKERIDNEIVFVMMPHVVRKIDLDDLNIKPVDIGTQNVIEIRHESKTQPGPVVQPGRGTLNVPSGAPSAPQQTPAGTPATGQPGATPQQQASAAAPASPDTNANAASRVGPVLSIDPPMVNQTTGATFAVNVVLNGGQNVFSVPTQVSYDPKVLQFVNVSNAGALSKDGAAAVLVHREDEANGVVQVSMMRPPGSSGINPTGPMYTLTFVAKAPGQANITVGKSVLRDPANQAVEAAGSQAIVNVR